MTTQTNNASEIANLLALPYLLFTALTLSENAPDNQNQRRDVALLLHKFVAKYP